MKKYNNYDGIKIAKNKIEIISNNNTKYVDNHV